jgi:hypothetical protein
MLRVAPLPQTPPPIQERFTPKELYLALLYRIPPIAAHITYRLCVHTRHCLWRRGPCFIRWGRAFRYQLIAFLLTSLIGDRWRAPHLITERTDLAADAQWSPSTPHHVSQSYLCGEYFLSGGPTESYDARYLHLPSIPVSDWFRWALVLGGLHEKKTYTSIPKS